ncbi:cell division protein FtsX [Polluticoccus soli]|uniref:cell division protein FtsX n=1 Tax=Polluticoccus soli TaxID=3034150 RepID=UPI0023E1F5AF|nr:permease-like cell division protein FtsX [Flavipsychrobacter sp. JY13-12]
MSTNKKAKPSYVYAVIGISLVLFLLGTLGWLVLNGRSLSRAFREDIQVDVIVHDNTRPENIQALKNILDKQPWVKKTEIVTKEEAAARFVQDGGEDYKELLDFNPLYSSILVNLHSDYVNKDSLEKIGKFVMQSNIVRDVTYPNTVVEKMNSNFQKLGLILGAISLLLFGVVIILIDNTVRLAMFSNRFLIKTMQMVGATRWFITRPFDRRAIINGLLSGLISVIGLWMVISFAQTQLPSLKALNDPILLTVLMVGMVLMGILISVVSTHRSVVKYLKMHVDDLY